MGTNLSDKWPLTYDFNGVKVLNLGSGSSHYPAENVTNLDAWGTPDVKWDLNVTPLPFASETFDFIIANHVLEHIQNWWALFEECARILKVGGRIQIWVPGAGDSVRGYRDHVHEINGCSFFGIYDNFTYDGNAWCVEYATGPANQLTLARRETRMYPFWWLSILPEKGKEWARRHLRNVVNEEGYNFLKIPKEKVNERIERVRAARGH